MTILWIWIEIFSDFPIQFFFTVNLTRVKIYSSVIVYKNPAKMHRIESSWKKKRKKFFALVIFR